MTKKLKIKVLYFGFAKKGKFFFFFFCVDKMQNSLFKFHYFLFPSKLAFIYFSFLNFKTPHSNRPFTFHPLLPLGPQNNAVLALI